VTRAAELAGRAPAGPVYLNVPLEVLLEPWDGDEPKPVARPGATVSAPEDLDAVRALLASAEHPVIVTETVGREDVGMAALVEFAEAFDIPVVEPNSAVCANFPRTHALHAGGDLTPFVDTADVIVLVNCRAPFYPPSRRPARAAIVVIDEVPQRPHLAYQVLQADHYLEGGTAATLRALAAGGSRTSSRPLPGDSVAAAETKAAANPDGIDPITLTATLRELLAGEDPVFVDETITHSRVVQRHLRRSTPDSYFYVQGGLGQGIAVALGVKLAAPGRTVVLTVGDGAFLYNPVIPSLLAARACGLPVLIVVYNNHKYLSMQLNHLRFYPEGAAVQTGEFLGVDLSDQPDLAGFAEPFAMHAESVSRPADLPVALDRALKAVRGGTTAIVNVRVTR
jgi:thiamine pyrophosphate-dependent acetolactate synthase large subunit-like protein